MGSEHATGGGSHKDSKMQSNSDDGGTKVSNIYQNKQLNTDVEKNYALQDDIFGNADVCAGESSEIGKDEKNKKNDKKQKKEKLLATANVEKIASAIFEKSSITNVRFIKELESLIRKGSKLAGMRLALDKLANRLKCPLCDVMLLRGQGRPKDSLACSTHGKFDVIDIGYQIPKEILIAYLGKFDKKSLLPLIERINSVNEKNYDNNDAIDDLFMDISDNENNNNLEKKPEIKAVNEKQLNLSKARIF